MNFFIKKPLISILIAGLILFSLAFFYFLFLESLYPNLSDRGLLGDSFGLLNALFSGLAFIGVMYTIITQQKEIDENSRIMQKERFESTFFKMLEFQILITNELSLVIPKSWQVIDGTNTLVPERTIIGKEAIKEELRLLLIHYVGKEDHGENGAKISGQGYSGFVMRSNGKFDRYFSNIDLIHKFILDAKSMTESDKVFYLQILSHQLDNNEVAFYFYYHTLYHFMRFESVEKLNISLIRFLNPDYLGHRSHLYFYYTREDLKMLHAVYDEAEKMFR